MTTTTESPIWCIILEDGGSSIINSLCSKAVPAWFRCIWIATFQRLLLHQHVFVFFLFFMSDSALVAPLSNIPTMSGMSHVMGLEQEVEAVFVHLVLPTQQPPPGGGGVGLHPRNTYQWSPPPPNKKKEPLTSYNEVVAEPQPTLRNQPIWSWDFDGILIKCI